MGIVIVVKVTMTLNKSCQILKISTAGFAMSYRF